MLCKQLTSAGHMQLSSGVQRALQRLALSGRLSSALWCCSQQQRQISLTGAAGLCSHAAGCIQQRLDDFLVQQHQPSDGGQHQQPVKLHG